MGETVPDLLEGLNDAQCAAVVHDGAPLIVLAGPGTGKTGVISRRVAHTVGERGADPESVVALTFTNKAAQEMRDRLAGLLGRSASERLGVYTFHSFGQRLLRRFADIAGLPPEPTLVDSAQQRRLLRSIIREHGLYPEARASGIDSAVAHASSMIEALRNHAIGPETGVARAQRVLESDQDDEARALAQRFMGAARAYGLFEEACRQRGWMSFSDMVLAPIRLLRESEMVRDICRGEFRHIVVDEFQDVNRAQIELLRGLAPPEGRTDLCVVGDDDQAIYAFRGADEQAFAHFREIWTDAETIALTESYRSQRAIIDASQATIARCAERFEPDKAIERAASLSGEAPLAGAGVEVVRVEDDGQHGEIVAAMILADMASRPGARLSDYAVIARTHTDADRVRRALELEGVPTRSARPPSASEDAGVQDVLAWGETLCNPEASWAARRVLMRPPLSFEASDVNTWERGYRAQASRAEAGDPGVASPGAYVPWVVERFGGDEALGERLTRLGAWHTELSTVAATARADEALTRIVQLTGAAHADLLDGRERARRIEAIISMIRFARGRVPRLDQPADLRAFLSYYEDLDERDRGFASPDPSAALEPEGADELSGGEAVSVLTAHASKGLEFDTVFLPRVTPSHGYPKTSGGDDEAPPEGVLAEGEDRPEADRRSDEERRVFYVASTRAQRRLVLLAKLPRSRSKSTHYTLELLEDGLASDTTAGEVLERAAEQGVSAGGDAIDREVAAYSARLARGDVFARARRDARLEAAAALHSVDSAGADQDEVNHASDRMAGAAQRLSIIASVERDGRAPGWVDDPGLARFAEELGKRAGSGTPDDAGGDARFAPLPAPLRLSYSHVKEYAQCPRCFYLRRVLRLGDPPGGAMIVGQVVHKALERFIRARAEAENEGRAGPGDERLQELGRESFFAMLPRGADADAAQLDQVLALLETAAGMLGEAGVQYLEPERMVLFPYERAGVEHVFEAKIDRIDQLGDGGQTVLRIVDYKTGHPSKTLLEPKRSDLQLAIYAMALRHEYGPEALATGEYWLLRTGQRGRLDLSTIDEKKIRTQIDRAIDGMLAGDWPRACRPGEGVCSLLDRV